MRENIKDFVNYFDIELEDGRMAHNPFGKYGKTYIIDKEFYDKLVIYEKSTPYVFAILGVMTGTFIGLIGLPLVMLLVLLKGAAYNYYLSSKYETSDHKISKNPEDVEKLCYSYYGTKGIYAMMILLIFIGIFLIATNRISNITKEWRIISLSLSGICFLGVVHCISIIKKQGNIKGSKS